MTALTTIVPDEALLLEVARSAAARHLKLLTNGRRSVLSPVDIPGFHPIIVKEKAMQATIRIEIEDEALRASVIGEDITIRVYGWPADQDRRRPTVYVGFHYYPLDTNITMSTADARELASTLLKAAEAAEKTKDEVAA